MTLLHQAAQKAVEAMPRYYMNAENGHMTESKRGAWVRWIDVVAALQHQEVPREPVARPSMSMYASAADYSAAMDGWIAATRQCPACRGKFGVDGQACDLCNATGRVPSTTRQQEVGSTAAVHLTADEISSLMMDLSEHDGRDFEAECPSCTAFRKLASACAAPSTPEKGEKDDATCPAHGGRYHWTQDCPECTKDARARGMSMDDYYSQVRPTLRTLGVDAPGEGQR